MDSSSSREHLLRSASAETANLRQELDSAVRAKDSAILENRRIQDDLASATSDCRCARNELELCRRQIEDLKRQLQHYVAEVKRFEDLMEQKEVERNELLDQFRSLSQEATILENNNHSLENEAAQSRVQLSVTLDHVADLETKLNTQDSVIADYEKQIAELSSHVSNLESQLDHYKQQQQRTEADLSVVRDLCMKLDKQKDSLMQELIDKSEQKTQHDTDILRLRRESETLQSTLEKDRMSLENVEKLLSDARQENVQLRLQNQELESEIRALKERLDELQSRLISTSEQLDFYQERALDYSQQNKQLRRDIASERSPNTATFTYSANLNPVPDNTMCTCCESCLGKNVTNNTTNREDAISASTVIVRTSPKNGCCSSCVGKLEGKTFEVTDTTKEVSSEWKSNPNQRGKFTSSAVREKRFSEISDKQQSSFRNSYSKQSNSDSKYTNSRLKHTSVLGTVGLNSSYLQKSLNVTEPSCEISRFRRASSSIPNNNIPLYKNSTYKSVPMQEAPNSSQLHKSVAVSTQKPSPHLKSTGLNHPKCNCCISCFKNS